MTMQLTQLYSKSHKIFCLSSTVECGDHRIYQLLRFHYSDLENLYKYIEKKSPSLFSALLLGNTIYHVVPIAQQ